MKYIMRFDTYLGPVRKDNLIFADDDEPINASNDLRAWITARAVIRAKAKIAARMQSGRRYRLINVFRIKRRKKVVVTYPEKYISVPKPVSSGR